MHPLLCVGTILTEDKTTFLKNITKLPSQKGEKEKDKENIKTKNNRNEPEVHESLVFHGKYIH